jgi:hypothetical protein
MNVDPLVFENNVRRIARELWPAAVHEGATIADGRERDGVFMTEFTTHILECTALGTKEKAEKDVEKIIGLILKLRKIDSSRTYLGWFVTLEEPTAHQRDAAKVLLKKHPDISVNVLSFDQFRAKVINAQAYIDLRANYRFGSIADPETGNTTQEIEYVPLGLLDRDNSSVIHHIKDICEGLVVGRRYLVLGDYGAGKSMSLRQIHRELVRSYSKSGSRFFPVFLNLRDHQNQNDPVEALHRHATQIGFQFPHHLVRAWRAGYAVVLLDGFDEIAKAGWSVNLHQMRQARFKALELIRRFNRESPAGTGLVVSGREHFFDNDTELKEALEIGRETSVLGVSEFTDEQIAQYLRKRGWKKPVPDWLPARPLLLGYLASKDLLLSTLEINSACTPAVAWDSLLDKICDREAKIEAGISGQSVRSVLERVATHARRSVDGIGPVSKEVVVTSFREVCAVEPDDAGLLLLMRLPGLGATNAEDGSRQFIDFSLADAARAGDIVRYIVDPYGTKFSESGNWRCQLAELGVAVAVARLGSMKTKSSKVANAAGHASENADYAIAADIVAIAHQGQYDLGSNKIIVKEIILPSIELLPEGGNIGNVEFQDCLIDVLDLPGELEEDQTPIFRDCSIDSIENRVGPADVSADKFINTTVSKYGVSSATTAAILNLGLPIGTVVALSILKKIYIQKGAGRRSSALYRGLDTKAKAHVPDVLEVLQDQELILKTKQGPNDVWIPVRSQAGRIRALLAAPNKSSDSLLSLTKSI